MSRTFCSAAAAALALAATPALAQFEGRLDYTMTQDLPPEPGAKKGANPPGKVTLYVSATGARSEMTGTVPDGQGGMRSLRIVTIWKVAEPRRTVMINESQKTYSVFEQDPAEGRTGQKAKLERLGAGKVAGYGCERVRITSGRGDGVQELCVTKELGKVAALARMTAEEDEDVFALLRDAGLDGVPVSMKTFGDEGEQMMAMQLTSARKQAVPASLFAVPAGYKETGMAGVFASPEQQKELDAAMKEMQERMKDMSPEQRKQMEEMMKKLGGGK